MTTTGSLRDRPLPSLLHEAFRDRLTGELNLVGGAAAPAVYFAGGFVTGADTADVVDLGDLLVELGMIDRRALDALGALAPAEGLRHGHVLVDGGLLTEAQLAEALTAQISRQIQPLFAWTEGIYRIERRSGPAAQGMAPRLHPWRAILEGVRARWHEPRLERELAPIARGPLRLREETAIGDYGFDRTERGIALRVREGGRSLFEWTAAFSAPRCVVWRVLYVLFSTGALLHGTGAASRGEPPSIPPTIPPGPARPLAGASPATPPRPESVAPGAPSALLEGEVALKIRDFPRAVAAFQSAVAANPGSGEALALLAWARFQAGESSLARSMPDLKRAAQLSPTCARAHYFLGLVQKEHAPEAALESFRRAARLDPRLAGARSEAHLLLRRFAKK